MPQNAIVPAGDRRPVARNAVLGGVGGADLALFVVSVMDYVYNPATVIAFTLIAMVAAALIAAAATLLITRRRPSFNAIEHNLERAVALLERGLIDEQDYHLLKQQILTSSTRADAPTVLRAAGWAAAVGALVPLFLFVATGGNREIAGVVVTALGGLVGGSIAGGTTYAVQALGSGGPRFRPLGMPDDDLPALDTGRPWLDSPASRDVG